MNFPNTLSRLPSVRVFHRIHSYWDNHLNKKENRNERDHKSIGIVFTTSLDVTGAMFGTGRSSYITIPDQPNLLQKTIAFFLVQTKIAEFARKENQWSGYAYSWIDARQIFGW